MSSFNQLSPLRFWCQKVLPLVYDDSLSYYELLCKIVKYINNMVEDINQIPDYIQELLSEETISELLSELMDELREEIVPTNEGENTTASADREQGDLLWLNGKLVVITRDILAGTAYIEETGEEGVTGNFIYTTIQRQMTNSYNSDNQRLTLYGWVDASTEVATSGDTHTYSSSTQTITIEEV